MDAREQLSEKNFKITEIGRWYKYRVYDLTNHAIGQKSIVLKEPDGRYRLLYVYFRGCSNVKDKPKIINVQGNSILMYRTRISGTGNFHVEKFFLFDENTQRPVLLDHRKAIKDSLARLLPKERSCNKGGGFDIKTLTYRNWVYQKGDGNCRGAGGSVRMKFRLKDFELVTIDEKYDPNDKCSP